MIPMWDSEEHANYHSEWKWWRFVRGVRYKVTEYELQRRSDLDLKSDVLKAKRPAAFFYH